MYRAAFYLGAAMAFAYDWGDIPTLAVAASQKSCGRNLTASPGSRWYVSMYLMGQVRAHTCQDNGGDRAALQAEAERGKWLAHWLRQPRHPLGAFFGVLVGVPPITR
jgi:hypothetical protein